MKTKTGVTHNFNFEATKNSYVVTVSVHDGKDAAGNTDTTTIDATITVTISLTNVNETPSVSSGPQTLSFGENTSRPTQLGTYVATDPDASSSFTWSLEGPDAGLFRIGMIGGILRFQNPLDYEMPVDSGTDNIYNVTVKVTDNGSPAMTPREASPSPSPTSTRRPRSRLPRTLPPSPRTRQGPSSTSTQRTWTRRPR